MGYLGRRIGKSQDTGNAHPESKTDVGGGVLDLFAAGYFERQGKSYNAPGTLTGLTATGGVISEFSEGPSVYRAHVFTSSGIFDVTSGGSFGDTIEYLVIGGGGAGGQEGSQRGGGGGAGGYRTNVPVSIGPGNHTTSAGFVVSVSPYTVTVGGGGAGSPPAGQGSDGSDSIFGPPSSPARIISKGGGGGGQGSQDSPPANEGRPGGSGGGGGSTASGDATEPGGATIAVTTPSPWPGPSTQGFAGGQGEHDSGSWAAGGGGGGAGEAGHAAQNPNTTSGDGGDGLSNLIAGPLNTGVGVVNPASPGRWFAGGGAGMHFGGGVSDGGAGGGGSTSHPGIGGSGVYATGSGGACGTPGGFGGSGIVIVRYKIAEITAQAKATGGNISFFNGKTIHAFTSSGTFINPASISNVDYIVLAGGGGGQTFHGSYAGGGGGAGGYILKEGQTLPAATHPIQVGAGGELGSQGTPSVFNSQTAVGGGVAGAGHPGPGGNGGSGGGSSSSGAVGVGENFPGPTQQGRPGGAGSSGGGHGGGGGGFGAAGTASGPPDGGGPGGVGVQLPPAFRDPVQAPSDTTNPVPYQRGGGLGTPGPAGAYYVAGGGGGGTWNPSYGTKGGDGGAGGGGRGAFGPSDGVPALNGVENTGGGGGGSGTSINGSFGGSGLVLIAYPT